MIASRRSFLGGGLAGTVFSTAADGREPNVNPRFSTIEYLRRYYRESWAALAVPERAESLPEWRDRLARRLRPELGIDARTAASLSPRITVLGSRPGRYRIERMVFSREPYAGNAVAREVPWKQGAGVEAFAGQSVRLRLVMSGAKYFPFRFGE